jgi:CheY-like chemotaxis protein
MHPARLALEALHGVTTAPEADTAPATAPSSARSKTDNRIHVAATRDILIVDDNDRHLDILSTILSSIGHDVETCGSGAEAIRRLDCRRYDLAILDLVMPEVSGALVAQQMRDGVLNKHTPIIVCTANVIIARREMASVPGVSAIIGKPIDMASLILAVSRTPIRERRPAGVRH